MKDLKKTKKFYSGKKKRCTLKTQVIVSKNTKKIICTNFSNGKKHNFKLFKQSKIHIAKEIELLLDSGYQGLHINTNLPKKKIKKTFNS